MTEGRPPRPSSKSVTGSPVKGRILVVDDDARIRSLHERILVGASYQVESAADGLEAITKLPLDVDLVLLDGDMPRLDGFDVAKRIRSDPEHELLPIMMVTGLSSPQDRRRAMELGINDFISKPVDPDLLLLRCRWLVELKHAYDRVATHNTQLRQAVEARTKALRDALAEVTEAKRLTHTAHLDTIQRLTVAAEYRDTDTAGHIERIGRYSEALARVMGLSAGHAERLGIAAPMHDVGKLAIPDDILLKPGKLDEREWEIMRSHTTRGAELLAGSPSPLLQLGELIALTHHERWDGSGYPQGISGEAIPIEGRICAVVDFFDALTMDRPYRRAVPAPEVLAMMKELSGSHFDPNVCEAFMAHRTEFEAIRQAYAVAS